MQRVIEKRTGKGQSIRMLCCLFVSAFYLYFLISRRYPLSTPETLGRLSTNVLRLDFWDRLGNKRTQVIIGPSFANYSQPIVARSS